MLMESPLSWTELEFRSGLGFELRLKAVAAALV